MVEFGLDTALLLGVSNIFVIPLFIFFVKLIIKVGNMENALESINKYVAGANVESKELQQYKTKLELMEQRVTQLEKNMDYVLNAKREYDRDKDQERKERREYYEDERNNTRR